MPSKVIFFLKSQYLSLNKIPDPYMRDPYMIQILELSDMCLKNIAMEIMMLDKH